MKIEKLDLKGFGKFNNFEIKFDEGFNVVYGENESGKSTIEAFIKAMLYSLKGGRNFKQGALTPQKRYKPWTGASYKGSMKYTLDNGQTFTVERNFDSGETRVYDSLYKDITKTFDQSKDKGPLFAIRHIGLTESCFEKTSFIGQMGTKLDASDSREILDRLSNIWETGFEDISFKDARDAIKDALKNYVGTDKTSTRPLDMINSKLNELNIRKQSLIKGRESLFSIEDEIAGLNRKLVDLEEEKAVILLAKDIIKLREELDVYKRKKKDLNDIVGEISELKSEGVRIAGSIREYQKTKEKLGTFQGVGFEDADELSIQYTKFESLNGEKERLLSEIQKLKLKAEEIEAYLESFKAFNSLGNIDIADPSPSTEFNLESFENEEIQRKIKSLSLKGIGIAAGMGACCVSIAVMLFYGFSGGRIVQSFIGSGALLSLFFVLAVLKNNNAKLANTLKDGKEESDKKVKALLDKIETQNKKQSDIFKMLEVTSIDEFLKKKALYDSKVYELNSQNERIDELEVELDKKSNMILDLLRSMKEKLLEASIINWQEDEVRKEHIEEFRNAVNRYKEITPYLTHGEEKLEELGKRLNNLYNRAYSISGQKVNCEERLAGVINEIDNKIKNLYKSLDVYAYKIKSIYAGSSFDGLTYDELMEIILDLGLEDTKAQIEEMMQKVLDKINGVQLSVKEREIALPGLTDDSNELEQIEEDVRQLEIKKAELEDTGFSLRTALEVLEEASIEIKRDFAPVLNSNTSKIVSIITSQRYGDIKVDENLIPRTTEPFANEIVPISVLSGGTIDQMYLALRIALVKTMESKSEKLPLIMDEILAQYDDTRSLDTLKMLKELSSERQIILFTCKSREVDLVKFVCNSKINVIELL